MGGARSDDSIEDRAREVPEVTTVSRMVRVAGARRDFEALPKDMVKTDLSEAVRGIFKLSVWSPPSGARSDDSIEDGAWEVPKVTTVSRIARGRCQT